MFQEFVPLDDKIQRSGIALASKCNCCSGGAQEDLDHLPSNGDFASKVWKLFNAQLGLPWILQCPCNSLNDIVLAG